MERLVVEYAQMGHREGCRYELPTSSEVMRRWHEQLRQEYEVLYITPHCLKDAERSAFRQQVYTEAQRVADDTRNRSMTIKGGMKAAEKVWRKTTMPWTEGPCPYFEPIDESTT